MEARPTQYETGGGRGGSKQGTSALVVLPYSGDLL